MVSFYPQQRRVRGHPALRRRDVARAHGHPACHARRVDRRYSAVRRCPRHRAGQIRSAAVGVVSGGGELLRRTFRNRGARWGYRDGGQCRR